MDSFINGAIGTALAELITSPICLIRTRQINGAEKNIGKIIINLYSDSGIKGFYSATLPAVLSQILSTSLKFGIYSNLKAENMKERILNGIFTGMIVSTITTPIEVIKVNIQTGNILGKNLSFFYQGYKKSLTKSIIGGALYFPLNDFFGDMTGSKVLGAVLSSVTAVTITQPVDYLKTRQMVGNSIIYNNFKKMYTGYGLNLFRIVPHFTIVMVTTDFLKSI